MFNRLLGGHMCGEPWQEGGALTFDPGGSPLSFSGRRKLRWFSSLCFCLSLTRTNWRRHLLQWEAWLAWKYKTSQNISHVTLSRDCSGERLRNG